jgi:hypothetical protein
MIYEIIIISFLLYWKLHIRDLFRDILFKEIEFFDDRIRRTRKQWFNALILSCLNNVLMFSSTECITKCSNWRQNVSWNVQYNNISICSKKLYQSDSTLKHFDMKHKNSIIIKYNEFFKYYLKQLIQHSRDKIWFFENQFFDEIVCENDFSSHEYCRFNYDALNIEHQT